MANPYPIYASDLTLFKCPLALYHCAVNRQKKPSLDAETIQRLNSYASMESIAIDKLRQSGWNIIKPINVTAGRIIPKDDQELFIYKDTEGNDIVRGRIDLVAAMQGIEEGGLYEVKTAGQYIYKGINMITDFIDSRHWWIPGQLAQWCMYMYMSGKNYGGIIQVDRDSLQVIDGTYHVEIKVHHASILKGHQFYNERVAEFMNLVVSNIDTAWDGALLGIEPEYCKDLSVCANCWCNRSVCFPPINNAGVEMGFIGTHSPDDIARLLEIEPIAKEYNKLKDKIEAPLKISIGDRGNPEQGWILGAGQYLAKAKITPRINYNIPTNIKKQYAEKGQSVSITIESLIPNRSVMNDEL